MTAVLDRVPVDRITAEAREVHPGRTLLALVAGILFGIGWLAGRLFLAVAWAAVAVKVGWSEGRTRTAPPKGDGSS